MSSSVYAGSSGATSGNPSARHSGSAISWSTPARSHSTGQVSFRSPSRASPSATRSASRGLSPVPLTGAGHRHSPPLPAPSSPGDRREVRDQLSLGTVLAEADHDDPSGLDPGDDSLPEGGMDHVLAEAVGDRRRLIARPRGLRASAGRPRRRASADPRERRALLLAVGEPGGDLAQEPAGGAPAPRAEHVPGPRVGQVQIALRARDADVAEAALFLEAPLVERARVREDSLLAADHEDDPELEPLGV